MKHFPMVIRARLRRCPLSYVVTMPSKKLSFNKPAKPLSIAGFTFLPAIGVNFRSATIPGVQVHTHRLRLLEGQQTLR
jgi:hypothetical protein